MAESTLSPQEIVNRMLEKDHFSRWLGLQIETCEKGYCRLHFTINDLMLNGFGSVHGGVLFAAADSAFAFASNSQGTVSVALDVSITYTRPAGPGEQLTVEAKEVHLGNKIGVYEVRTTNAAGELIALFKGTAWRTTPFIRPETL